MTIYVPLAIVQAINVNGTTIKPRDKDIRGMLLVYTNKKIVKKKFKKSPILAINLDSLVVEVIK